METTEILRHLVNHNLKLKGNFTTSQRSIVIKIVKYSDPVLAKLNIPPEKNIVLKTAFSRDTPPGILKYPITIIGKTNIVLKTKTYER